MNTWKTRSLRLTVFLGSDGAAKANDLEWQDLTGEKPENVMNRRDQQAQEGPFLLGRLFLQKQLPARLDVVYVGSPKAEDSEDPVATLGPFEPAGEIFRGITHKVLDRVGSCQRLALGTEMVQPAHTALAAYEILVEHMRSATFRIEGGSEFVYQMNRPRDSKVLPGLLINRLARWNASSWQPVTVELTGPIHAFGGQPRVGAVITTDVNTDGERTTPLPGEKVREVFDELRELTVEIRDKGDIP